MLTVALCAHFAFMRNVLLLIISVPKVLYLMLGAMNLATPVKASHFLFHSYVLLGNESQSDISFLSRSVFTVATCASAAQVSHAKGG